MARLLLCVLALCASGAFGYSVEELDSKVLQERQKELLALFNHIHEPIKAPKYQEIARSWDIEKNLQHYSNVTAAKTYAIMIKDKWHLPRAVPFAVNEHAHAFEAMTLFHVLYSAKDYETFYKTAVYVRDIINEGLFVYVFSVAILYRHDTQGITIPPIYEIFPSYFNNAEIMTTAQRINTHGHHFVKNYPSTYVWDDNVVIRWNATAWPYYEYYFPVTYFTHDATLNAHYYYQNLLYPYWLGSHVVPGLRKERRGEFWWFSHKQLLARYYMELLSNGLSEIPDITEIVKNGYSSGLSYHNGIPFPSRPNYYHLNNPDLTEELEAVVEYERRIWDSIDRGFFVNKQGEHASLLSEEGLDILGRLVQANADSPNVSYYKDFLKIWKAILGNSHKHHHQYVHDVVPLVVPSVLENYHTTLRDPAFYMIWKRIAKLFFAWHKQMPMYKYEELAFPAVSIEKVENDKLVTFFEHYYMNVTNHLYLSESESKGFYDDVSVLVQHPRLNHKQFTVRVHVKSDVAKTVLVKFFLAPKYDSNGYEIPLHLNYENFFLFDQFTFELPVGDSVISRDSIQNSFTVKEWTSSYDIHEKLVKGQWLPDMGQSIEKYPHHLLLPKGKVGGMPFQLVVYIHEYRAPKVPFGTGFDPKVSLGLGSGARYMTDEPYAFPVDRPLYAWQVENVHNLYFHDVLIHHKHAPEIDVPHTE